MPLPMWPKLVLVRARPLSLFWCASGVRAVSPEVLTLLLHKKWVVITHLGREARILALFSRRLAWSSDRTDGGIHKLPRPMQNYRVFKAPGQTNRLGLCNAGVNRQRSGSSPTSVPVPDQYQGNEAIVRTVQMVG